MTKEIIMPPDAKELSTVGADKISRPTHVADQSEMGSLKNKHGSLDQDQRFRDEGKKNSGGPA